MNAKPILNDPESSSQDGNETSRADDGLRLLGRIIARNLLARRSVHTNKNDTKENNPQTLADS
jgi:hypothetical protein